jgi:hypothetical protein
MLWRTGCAAVVTPLAALHIACSPTPELPEDPYARCVDLGELALVADSRLDALRRMETRVLELGGDTLLFGERGRSGRLADSPEEIVQRRNKLLAVAEAGGDAQPAAEIASEQIEESEASEAEAADVRQPAAKITAEEIQDSPGELWYYGAALRCELASPPTQPGLGGEPSPR